MCVPLIRPYQVIRGMVNSNIRHEYHSKRKAANKIFILESVTEQNRIYPSMGVLV